MTAMIVATPKCLLEVDLSHLKHSDRLCSVKASFDLHMVMITCHHDATIFLGGLVLMRREKALGWVE